MKGNLHFDCTTTPPTITGHLEFGAEDYSPEKRDLAQMPPEELASRNMKRIEEARAAGLLPPRRTRSGWEPIETAPKSGAGIDLWAIYSRGRLDQIELRDGERITDAYWKDGVGWVKRIEDGDYSGETWEVEWNIEFQKDGVPTGEWNKQVATHWRRLPDPAEVEDDR